MAWVCFCVMVFRILYVSKSNFYALLYWDLPAPAIFRLFTEHNTTVLQRAPCIFLSQVLHLLLSPSSLVSMGSILHPISLVLVVWLDFPILITDPDPSARQVQISWGPSARIRLSFPFLREIFQPHLHFRPKSIFTSGNVPSNLPFRCSDILTTENPPGISGSFCTSAAGGAWGCKQTALLFCRITGLEKLCSNYTTSFQLLCNLIVKSGNYFEYCHKLGSARSSATGP